MLNFLLRRFIPNHENTRDPAVRRACGTLAGVVGILLNLLLFAGKLTAGLLAGAISVTADAFNNLTDAASSVVTLVGFRLAGRKPDADHPFGHGRIEYLAGLAVSLIILLVGFELGKSSVLKILHPEETELSLLTAVILGVSVLVKLWMSLFSGRLGRRIGSETLNATAADSRSDAIATAAGLLGLVIGRLTSLPLDGWIGVLVAILILKAGFDAARSTLDPLLGQAADPETVREIQEAILSHREILGIHDLVIHDYGPGRRMMSAHAEVSCASDVMAMHDTIDRIERELEERFAIRAVLHMDPIRVGDPEVDRLRALALQLAREIHPEITLHDFRITSGPLHTNLIFDMVVPYEVTRPDSELKALLAEKLSAADPNYYAVIDVDRPYVG